MHSEETKRKISESLKGNKRRLGKPHTEEARRKIGEAGKKRVGEKNSMFGKKHTAETRMKMTEAQKGLFAHEKNPMWKGDDVSNKVLHKYIRRHLPQPHLCEFCNTKPSEDLANITGIYNREFINWKYLCRKCHHDHDKELHKRNSEGRFIPNSLS